MERKHNQSTCLKNALPFWKWYGINPLQINWHKRCSRGEGHKQHQWYNYMSLQRPLSRSLPAAFQVPPPAKIRSRSLHWLLSRSPSGQGLSSSCCAGPNTVCRQGPSISWNPGSSFHCGSGTSNSWDPGLCSSCGLNTPPAVVHCGQPFALKSSINVYYFIMYCKNNLFVLICGVLFLSYKHNFRTHCVFFPFNHIGLIMNCCNCFTKTIFLEHISPKYFFSHCKIPQKAHKKTTFLKKTH